MPEYYIQPVTNRQECYTCHKVATGKKKFSKCSECHAITYCCRECQKKDWPRHCWNCVPVMVTEIPGRGRGLVAAKDIKKGELIFIDKPVIEVNETKFLANREAECKLLVKKVDNLPSEAKIQFYRLKGFGGKSFEDLKSSKGELLATLNLFLTNSLRYSLYLNMALVNHSCIPNADDGQLMEEDDAGKPYNRREIRAIKDISKGEEITYSILGDVNSICCSMQRRKMSMKNNHDFDCNCDVCSGLIMDQENMAMELFDLLQTLPSPNHFSKGLSEWATDAKKLDKINDIMQDFQLGNLKCKVMSTLSLVKTAQLARNQDLVKKGLDMFKRLSEDIKIKEIGRIYESAVRVMAHWSNNLKSKKKPERNEIEFFLADNLLTEVNVEREG